MRVSEFLKAECCLLDVHAEEKAGAIKEIAELICSQGGVKEPDKFLKDVMDREELGSTGIGNGVAVPHARTSAVNGFIIGFGKSEKGIAFKALDGEPVHLVFLMGADPDDLNHYLRILAELSKLLMNNSFREELMSAKTADEVVDVIKRFE